MHTRFENRGSVKGACSLANTYCEPEADIDNMSRGVEGTVAVSATARQTPRQRLVKIGVTSCRSSTQTRGKDRRSFSREMKLQFL